MSEGSYLHGSAPDEQRRLAKMNDLLNAPLLRELRLQGNERVLDVGCGICLWTGNVAQHFPHASYQGVEIISYL